MNSVEKVKAICKEKKIPISKLERDLGFGNGYVGQLKKGSFPDDRLLAIANYLNVTTDYLMGSEQKEKSPTPEGMELDAETIQLREIWDSADQEERKALLAMAKMLKARRNK